MKCRTCSQDLNDGAAVCTACGCPPLAGNKFCQSCGAETSNTAATVCLKCGAALGGNAFDKLLGQQSEFVYPSVPPKDPVLMAVLGGVIPFLGQIIMGQTIKGIVMMVVTLVALSFCLGIVLFPIAAVDAYLIAKKLQAGRPVKQWEFF